MLPRQQRLTRIRDFDRVFKKGRMYSTPLLLFRMCENNMPGARVGIIVSNKVSKHAVVRNKIKRRIREIIRKHLVLLNGTDVIIIAKKTIVKVDFLNIQNDIDKCVKVFHAHPR